jgi:polyisoprenoid-binding protein YceI
MTHKLIFLASLCALCVSNAVVAATPETYELDLARALVTWEVKHFATSTTRGRFFAKGGSITLDREAGKGKVDVVIDMPTLSTGVLPFDARLKGEEFFDTKNYPEGRFTGTRLRFKANELVEVRGDLTLRDKTMPATLTATHFNCYVRPAIENVPERQVCGGDFETTISRGQFGMAFGWPFISDNVRLLIQIEAFKMPSTQ